MKSIKKARSFTLAALGVAVTAGLIFFFNGNEDGATVNPGINSPEKVVVAYAGDDSMRGSEVSESGTPQIESESVRVFESPQIEVERLVDVYADYLKKAQDGDAQAAFALGSVLQVCIGAPKSEKEAKELDESVYLAANDRNGLSDIFMKQFKFCAGLTAEQVRATTGLLELAAENGLPGAKTRLALAAIPDMAWGDANEREINKHQERRQTLLQEAMNEGDVKAALALATEYESSNESGSKLSSIAICMAVDSKIKYRAVSNCINRISTTLRPHELEEARQRAGEIAKGFGDSESFYVVKYQ